MRNSREHQKTHQEIIHDLTAQVRVSIHRWIHGIIHSPRVQKGIWCSWLLQPLQPSWPELSDMVHAPRVLLSRLLHHTNCNLLQTSARDSCEVIYQLYNDLSCVWLYITSLRVPNAVYHGIPMYRCSLRSKLVSRFWAALARAALSRARACKAQIACLGSSEVTIHNCTLHIKRSIKIQADSYQIML